MLLPGYVAEILVLDFTEESGFEHDDFYLRYTGIARILHASSLNEEALKDLPRYKEGDIVFLGDSMSVMSLNPEWEDWFKYRQSPNSQEEAEQPEPVKYLRRIHSWISHGKLLYMDRTDYLLRGVNLKWDEKTINAFRGPYVFEIEPQEIHGLMENPFEFE